MKYSKIFNYYVVAETQLQKHAIYSKLKEEMTIEDLKKYYNELKELLNTNNIVITTMIKLDEVKL